MRIESHVSIMSTCNAFLSKERLKRHDEWVAAEARKNKSEATVEHVTGALVRTQSRAAAVTIDDLPDEVLSMIMGKLSFRNQLVCSSVSRRWKTISRDLMSYFRFSGTRGFFHSFLASFFNTNNHFFVLQASRVPSCRRLS